MGVPKFYRWISERYPCLSEVVKEHQFVDFCRRVGFDPWRYLWRSQEYCLEKVPEFDNLYLDMNGIIHNCSHPNDEDPHFRITEEQIFCDIFHYIEVLFRIVRPKRTFFMAVDGVAPRAKMNQQRGRRFRSAKDAEERIKQALKKGEVLPTEKRFDSNCITPGTKFMVKLQTQLEYFVQNKITYDQSWQGIEVYLSGHETPGEGEHKIMEYIRYERSQPDYDPNTRHCLYGLDADLMILALCSHEPHFALLREEVRFTKRKDDKRTAKAEETTFHLLHVSLMREYIDHEFESLKETLPFPYDLESIIDDWVLMGFLVGNDFIPHLPDLHINSNALPMLYQTYMTILPKLGGYLNQGGTINLSRFQAYLKELHSFDEEHFEEVYEDYKWLASRKKNNENKLESKEVNNLTAQSEEKSIQIVKDLAMSQGVYSLSDSDSQGGDEQDDSDPFYREFKAHKKHYYNEKFNVTPSDEQIHCIAFEYIRGLQWICHYYYNGVQSWSWYYPYHYSPYISDLKNVAKMKLKFKMNKPFLPYEQLLAVLPDASKDCIPEAYWRLMDEDSSEIGDFYPTNFSTDLNGKKQEWEAVVVIPFIDEARLLKAMESCFSKTSEEERSRNKHGPCQLYVHDPSSPYPVQSTLPGVLFDMEKCVARRKNIPLNAWSKLPINQIVKGLLPGCDLSVYIKGFSTLYHLPHTVTLKKQSVKVFQAPSRNENMILQIVDCNEIDSPAIFRYSTVSLNDESLEETAHRILGQSVYVNWPHMEEAKVVAVSDGSTKFFLQEHVTENHGSKHKFARKDLNASGADEYSSDIASIYQKQLSRHGIDVGDTKVLLYAQILLGSKYICGKNGEISLEKQWSSIPQPYAMQMTVKSLTVKGPTFEKMRSLEDLFPVDAEIFHLNIPHYGSSGKVIRVKDGNALVKLDIVKEPDLSVAIQKSQQSLTYYHGYKAAGIIGISSYLLARITGTIYVYFPSQKKWNVGLNLKFTKEGCCIAGYTRRENKQWLYSSALIQVLKDYKQKYSDLFNYISKTLSNNNEADLNAEVIFGSENTNEKLISLSDWLKSLPCAGGRKIKEHSSVLDKTVITAVHDALTEFKQSDKSTRLVMQLAVPPRFLYRPIAQQGALIPDKHAQHYLLDRVVNVRAGYTVPLGYRGTVVGVHMEGIGEKDIMLDVLFDEEFLGGLTLSGQCPERRGYKLPVFAVINLSYGDRLMNKQADRPIAIVKPHHQQNTFEPIHGESNLNPMNKNQRSSFVQSPHSAFSPARKTLFRPNHSNNIKLLPRPQQQQAHVRHAIPSGMPRNNGPGMPRFPNTPPDPQRSRSRDFYKIFPDTNQAKSNSCSLDQAAKWLPQVDRKLPDPSSNSSASDVRTVSAATYSAPASNSKLNPSLQGLTSSNQSQTSSGFKDEQKSKATSSLSNEDLSQALKSTLKIPNIKKANSKEVHQPVQASTPTKEEDKAQLEKLLAALKVTPSPNQSNTPRSVSSQQKPFSLKDFLLSNSSKEKYPVYSATSKPVLLRPDSLKPSSSPIVKKEGADKLWELLEINNEEKKANNKHNNVLSTNDTTREIDDADKKSSHSNDALNDDNDDKQLHQKGQVVSSVENLKKWCNDNGLAPPTYTWYPVEQGEKTGSEFSCMAHLSTGSVYHSSAKRSKIEAMDDAASKALTNLMKNNPIPPNALPTTVSLSPFNAMPPPYPPHLQYTKDGKPIVPPPYLFGPPPSVPPPFAVTSLPPPNYCLKDGVVMYPPPPGAMLPYSYPTVQPPFFAMNNPRLVPHPLLTTVVSPSNHHRYVSALPFPPVSSEARFCSSYAENQYRDTSPFVTSTSPFIPSQVMTQHYSTPVKTTNHNNRQTSELSIQEQKKTSSEKTPTTVKNNQTGKKPKGKLAISFSNQAK